MAPWNEVLRESLGQQKTEGDEEAENTDGRDTVEDQASPWDV